MQDTRKGIPEAAAFAAIVGAPRCGTTALSDFLSGHPDVCFATPKEPHYFTLNDFRQADDATLRGIIAGDYLPRYFSRRRGEERLLAEGSVSYLYSPETTAQLLRIWPAAKFIICLRDPMALLPSLHLRNLYQGDETEEDFATAWGLTAARAGGERIPRSCLDPRLLRYDEIGRLGGYLEAFLARMGRERCHIVLYDDLAARPERVIAELQQFLDLPDDGRRTLPRARGGRMYRVGWLQRFLKRPPGFMRGVMAGWHYRQRVKKLTRRPAIVEAAVSGVIRLHKAALRLNGRPARPAPVPVDVRREIRAAFVEDVARLSRLTGRDLSHWLRVDEPSAHEVAHDEGVAPADRS